MRKFLNSILTFLVLVLLVGVSTAGIDYLRMTSGDTPIFNIKSFDSKTKIQTFRGLFYLAERKVRNNENESLVDSSNMKFSVLNYSIKVPRKFKDIVWDYTIETEEVKDCMEESKLYFANKDIKVYTYCLNKIEIKDDSSKKELITYLDKKDIMDDIENKLGYTGLYRDGSTLMFESMNDDFTNSGLAIYQCHKENIPDVYIGPKNMEFQNDFCTYKDDDFRFMFEIEDKSDEVNKDNKTDVEGTDNKEVFYEDENYKYVFDSEKSEYITLVSPATRGREEARVSLKDALNNGLVTIDDLEKKGLTFEKEEKEK